MATRFSGVLVYAGAVLLLIASLVVATAGLAAAVVIIVLLAGLTGLVVLGLTRAGILALIIAFATAPMYRGLEGLSGGVATPTDLMIVAGSALILPGVISRRLGLPPVYVVGLVLVALFSLVGSILSVAPAFSLFALVQWLFFLGGFPILIAWWRPSTTTIVTLLWAYVVGQGLSTAYALATGPVVGDRYQGLSHHTNAFGMAGMTALAILLYLFAHHRGVQARVFVVGAGVVSAASVVMSGSRAALVVAAVLVLLMPVVERSAAKGFVLGIFGAIGLVMLPLVIQGGHGGSALTRLAGQGTAASADNARTTAFSEGLDRFLASPVLGSGLDNVELFHNIFLEVAIGGGVIALVGYLMVLFVMARPLLSHHVHKRLAYLPLAWIGMAPALPGLWDRTMWVPIGLSLLAVVAPRPTEGPDADDVVSSIRRPWLAPARR